MAGRRGRQHTMAEIEDMRAPPQRRQDLAGGPLHGLSADNQQHRVEIALHRRPALNAARRPGRIRARIEAHTGADFGEFGGDRSGAARKEDQRRRNAPFLQPCCNSPRRLQAPASHARRRQQPGPAVEQLQRLGAGRRLRRQMLDRGLHQQVDQCCKTLRLAEHHAPDTEPGRGSSRPRPYRPPPSRARRRTRSGLSGRAGPRAPALRLHRQHPGGPPPDAMQPYRGAPGPAPCPPRSGTSWPMAWGIVRMSENRIAASVSKRRTGCSVISAASRRGRSKDRGSSPPRRAACGIPAGSVRPGA